MSCRNVVFIVTDTTNKHHLGCYGYENVSTPNHDRLAAEGLCFDRAYSSSPVCTAARGCMFSGLYASANGANYNDATCYRNVPMMGEVASAAGVRVGYTGKWHLDGGLYNGYGKADGGFPQEWWYDGKCYVDDIGPEKAKQWKQFARQDWNGMLENAFDEEDCWGHRVSDRAIDFLETAGDDQFLLCVSFDEPHGPFMCPRRFLEAADPDGLAIPPNVNMSLEDLPEQRKLAAKGHVNSEEDLRRYWRYYSACLSYVDYEIGRVCDAARRLHGDDTIIICTSDHGEQMGSHNTWGKGWAPYNECLAIPLLISGSGVQQGQRPETLAGHIDLLPTICDVLDIQAPNCHGRSLAPVFESPADVVRDFTCFTHDRFGNDGEPGRHADRTLDDLISDRRRKGAFYPMRGILTARYKLVINLFETDEFYDIQEDPYEMRNLIEDSGLSETRDRLHDQLMLEMTQCGDPMRCPQWYERSWRSN